MLEDTQCGMWVVAVMERVLCVGVALLNDVYEEYALWWLPPGIIRFALQLGMAMLPYLESTRNVHEALELIEVI